MGCVDGLIRLIENFIRSLLSVIQPLVEDGNIGYFFPALLLIGVTLFVLTSGNRLNLIGYALGWLIAITLISLYIEGNGDQILLNLTGTIPRTEFGTPGLLGGLVGFFLLFPFIRRSVAAEAPLIVTVATAGALLLMFLTWRASQSVPILLSSGQEELIVYRKRYVGTLALGFTMGLLGHVLLSAATPPPPPHPPNPPPYNQF